MQTLPTASPAEQAVVIKAAEARYKELGIPMDTAAILFQNEITKAGQFVQPLVQGITNPGNTLMDFWSALPEGVRKGLVNALIGGGIGGLGGAGYGLLSGGNMAEKGMAGAGYGALAGALTPDISNLLQKFSEDTEAAFASITKTAVDTLVNTGIPAEDAEQLVLYHLKKTAAECCEGDKGDFHMNTKGEYPTQVFAADKKKKTGDDTKQKKIKKIASDLTEALKTATCAAAHGASSKPKDRTTKSKPKKEAKE